MLTRSALVLGCLLCANGCGASGPASQPAAPSPSNDTTDAPSRATASDLQAAAIEGGPPAPLGNASQEDHWWEANAPCLSPSKLVHSEEGGTKGVFCQTDKRVNQGRGTTFHGNGKKESEGYYANNFATGVRTEWDRAGNKILEAEFDKGSENGMVIEYHPNGKVKAERRYVHGKRQGPSILWDEEGNKRLHMPYDAGKQHGTATHWTADGRVLKLERWEHDQLVETQTP